MHLCIKLKVRTSKEILCEFFLVLCCIPFLFPNPVVKTNIQPYAALVGSVIFIFRFNLLFRTAIGRILTLILGCTFIVALLVMVYGGISIEGLRGLYNYYALFIVLCSVIIVLEELGEYPEALCKTMIVLWFIVASIQFFIYRGFATKFISSVRWSYGYRGVVGLASEPSFLGISCFYFLHIVRKFKSKRILFNVMTLIMGIIYAQSAMGVLFIAGYYVVYLLDVINSKKGVYIWAASVIALIILVAFLNANLVDSRLNQMINAFLNGGVDSILSDESANTRFIAIVRALQATTGNMVMPHGFGSRIGSAYGGMLVEIGVLAIPSIILISYGFSLTFNKKRSRIVYFIVVTFLFLNNTQIGNPMLLMVIGTNAYDLIVTKRLRGAIRGNAEIHQDPQKDTD